MGESAVGGVARLELFPQDHRADLGESDCSPVFALELETEQATCSTASTEKVEAKNKHKPCLKTDEKCITVARRAAQAVAGAESENGQEPKVEHGSGVICARRGFAFRRRRSLFSAAKSPEAVKWRAARCFTSFAAVFRR